MKFSSILPIISIATAVYIPGQNYSTFTPSDGLLPSATTDYTSTFGIAINAITSSVSLSSVASASPGVSQEQQGLITQIGDGQIQATTSTPPPKTIAHVVTQIGDGQIQAATFTPSTTSTSTAKTTANVVTQIGDGQIQNQDPTTLTTKYITSASSEEDITTFVTITPTETLLQTVTSAAYQTLPAETVTVNQKRDLQYACASDEALSMTLESSILRDGKGRVGSIVSNRQFQFDGPFPQADAIYTAGWSIVDGKLALGNSTTFYQCLSGDFYNLYDEKVAEQCVAVELDIVNIIKC